MTETLKQKFIQHVLQLQDEITQKMQQLEPTVELIEDPWQRVDHAGQAGGGGRTRAFRGKLFENAGVNTSNVFGAISPEFAQKMGSTSDQMWATGISLIIHPTNPKVPTVHANFRMIEMGDKIWFGGGADLTPYYPIEEDFHYFHQVWKEACAPYGVYPQMKKTCDEYFVNHHRNGEMRGIGGLFFDHWNSGDLNADFEMVINLSNQFIKSYFPIVEKRQHENYTERDEEFQLHRRGRYVEFNLLHDRGTLFGLKTNGRIESILISLPARCRFTYNYQPPVGSPQEKMMSYYRPQNW
ncbi:MAG: oxygen-dependent coproporphyrinogen oxidase [Bdellovibrio sp. CG12_big_fil_rev_8_21_14_0_65_39_13]|nr:MAG: oxygen-dependent coproporphyrinogen oxidase [Bdellovibrio sp. CG22_combo_CG10-13_8_21_14_all_39_27]PIQ61488.1 MAG: oxygen-dependent coproporphyrinogen oxidase [Bdellovibrio sp. CG12_big_fil_rev_8_21_14_0_65_39_13]PIR35334.1 MAG: oxygen-dependent coproporphyrinogen oxidase [Bdellovibrio sp. CG11_big_fil_rev_8_21_14_0_20_39_38]PJB53160.1 MAG: oxygen-dependent coproporphyrinogen oxidase [Bdellovibrio sp. CG_4_9_14_3_um_filter_39_7]